MAQATVEVKNQNLIITIPLEKVGKPSSTGKSIIYATTNGSQKTGVTIEEKELVLTVNAYTSAK